MVIWSSLKSLPSRSIQRLHQKVHVERHDQNGVCHLVNHEMQLHHLGLRSTFCGNGMTIRFKENKILRQFYVANSPKNVFFQVYQGKNPDGNPPSNVMGYKCSISTSLKQHILLTFGVLIPPSPSLPQPPFSVFVWIPFLVGITKRITSVAS